MTERLCPSVGQYRRKPLARGLDRDGRRGGSGERGVKTHDNDRFRSKLLIFSGLESFSGRCSAQMGLGGSLTHCAIGFRCQIGRGRPASFEACNKRVSWAYKAPQFGPTYGPRLAWSQGWNRGIGFDAVATVSRTSSSTDRKSLLRAARTQRCAGEQSPTTTKPPSGAAIFLFDDLPTTRAPSAKKNRPVGAKRE